MEKETIEGFRLSPQQRRIWSLQRAGHDAPYCAQCALHVEGAQDAAALRGALESVTRRFEILRTEFRTLPGMSLPVQVIKEEAAPVISEEDLSRLTPSEQAEMIEALLAEARAASRDPAQGPAWRASVVRLSPSSYELLLTLPALCADGLSLKVLVRELARAYAAAVGKAAGDADEGPLQYADVAEWQNELCESEESAAGREFWAGQDFARAPSAQLPFAKHDLGNRRVTPDSLTLAFDARFAARVERLAKRKGAGLSDFLLACWHLLLWRLTGEREVLTGVTYDGRNYEELAEVIGPLARALPVRAELEESSSFGALLKRTRESVEAAGRWQECFNWGEAGDGLKDAAGPRAIPFGFEFAEWPEESEAGGATFRVRCLYTRTEAFKVKLNCFRAAGELRLEFHFDAGVYAAEDVARTAAHYRTLLEDVAAEPDATLAELDIVGEDERRQLLEEFAATKAAPLPPDKCVQDLFEEWAEKTPDALALVCEGSQLTYAGLNERANRLARYLRRHGVGAETPVGLLFERSAEAVIGMLGVLKAGGAYVPLDPALPAERLALMLEEARPPVLLTSEALSRKVASPPSKPLKVVRLDADWQTEIARESRADLRGAASPTNVAYVLFTSGSTGRPKGVAVEHRQLLNYLSGVSERLAFEPGMSFALVSTLAADLGNTSIFPALCGGGCLHVIAPERVTEPAALAAYFRAQQIDCLKIVPSHLEALQSFPHPEQLMPLRRLVLGGEASRRYWVRELQALAPGCTIFNHYGPTETTVGVLTYEVGAEAHARRAANVPLGRPISNVQVYLLDPAPRPTPVWVPGELHVGGLSVARGYHGRPGATAEKFIPDPFGGVPGARLYRTGDLARWLPTGDAEFLGRIDHQVKLRGFRIEPGEIEAAILGSDLVREALVVLGESAAGDKRLVAYVVPRKAKGRAGAKGGARRGREAPAFPFEELRRSLQERLPEYMMPAAVVPLERMPLTPNGKVDRRALPAPESAAAAPKREYVAPRNELERQLAQVWEEVLGVRPVGVTDNFFALGGYSLLALRLMARVNQQFGCEISLQNLLRTETVEAMAEFVGRPAGESSESPLVALQPEGAGTPLFFMHPVAGSAFVYVALARLLGTERPFYGLNSPVNEPLTKIEEMAARYVEAVRAVRPEGPYLLGGWSMGGLIAYEMAQQLRAQGQEVALLALIDRAAFDAEPQARDDAVLQSWFEQTIESVRGQAEATGGELWSFGPTMYHRLFQVYKNNHRAVEQYAPRPYAGRVTLLRAAETPVVTPDPTLGWGALAADVDLHVVPGTHTSMLHEPEVRVLAERLRACVERATDDGPRAAPRKGERAPPAPGPRAKGSGRGAPGASLDG
jgi:amino acid adenylation domain-containing protein